MCSPKRMYAEALSGRTPNRRSLPGSWPSAMRQDGRLPMMGKSSPRIRLGRDQPGRRLQIDVCSTTQRCRCLTAADTMAARQCRSALSQDNLVLFVRTRGAEARGIGTECGTAPIRR